MRKGDILVLYIVCGALYAGFLESIIVPNYTLGYSEQDTRKKNLIII
jgi:hypothetical protein